MILVNQDTVTFLDECEADRIKFENCPAYIGHGLTEEKVEEIGDANNRISNHY